MKKKCFFILLGLLISSGINSEEMKWKEIDESRLIKLDYGEDYEKLNKKWWSLSGKQKVGFQHIKTGIPI